MTKLSNRYRDTHAPPEGSDPAMINTLPWTILALWSYEMQILICRKELRVVKIGRARHDVAIWCLWVGLKIYGCRIYVGYGPSLRMDGGSSYYTAYTLLYKVIILMGKKEVEKRKMHLQIMLLVLVLGETSINSISSIGLIVLALASFLEQWDLVVVQF